MKTVIGYAYLILIAFIVILIICTLCYLSKKKRARARRNPNGTHYYFLATNVEGSRLKILDAHDFGHDPDNRRYNAGNYYLTLQDAEAAKASILKIIQH